MPPKPKFTKDEIVTAALEVVSKGGIDALTAQSLGNALGSSARPIFTVFRSMKEVHDEVRLAATERLEHFREGEMADMPAFKQMGMRMVLFGLYEPYLFQLLFMRGDGKNLTFDDVFGHLGDAAQRCVETVESEYRLTGEEAKLLFENVWIYTFGVGALCATGGCNFSEENLSELLTTQFRAVMGLIRTKHA